MRSVATSIPACQTHGAAFCSSCIDLSQRFGQPCFHVMLPVLYVPFASFGLVFVLRQLCGWVIISREGKLVGMCMCV
jgi:hypothetical protein